MRKSIEAILSKRVQVYSCLLIVSGCFCYRVLRTRNVMNVIWALLMSVPLLHTATGHLRLRLHVYDSIQPPAAAERACVRRAHALHWPAAVRPRAGRCAARGRHDGGAPPHLLAKIADIPEFGGWTFQMGPLAIRHGAMQSLQACLAHTPHELFFSPLW